MVRLGILVLLLLIISAWAQPAIEINTDKQDYTNGEIIHIEGRITLGGKPFAEKFVSLEIRDATDEVKYVSTKTTNSQGEFKDSLVLPKSDMKSVYSLTASVENAKQTVTFKYGGGTEPKENGNWIYWAFGGFGAVILLLASIIVLLISKQRKKEVKHITRQDRIEELARQIKEIEAKYGITERSVRLREKLDEMKK